MQQGHRVGHFDVGVKMNAPTVSGAIPTPSSHCYQLRLSHVKQSPFAEQVEAETIAWMFAHQLFLDDSYFKRVKKMEISKYAGYSHPFGDYDALLLFAKYITLWLLWDDFVIEKQADTKSLMAEMQQVFEGGLGQPRSKDNYISAWQSIILEYLARGASMKFMRRLGRNMLIWMQAAAQERASVFVAKREDFDDYLNRRIITIGMIPTAQLLELSSHLASDEAACMVLMSMASAKIVAFSNELVSVRKDGDWLNLVNIYQELQQCSLDDAYLAVVAMHDSAVAQYAALLRGLEPDKQHWGRYLQYCAEGFSYWHTVCGRYGCAGIHAIVQAPDHVA